MRGGGGNLTTTHVEELSLCSLFLMDAAKKTKNVHRFSTAHTIRDATRDINKMANILIERQVTSVTEGRDSPKFEEHFPEILLMTKGVEMSMQSSWTLK